MEVAWGEVRTPIGVLAVGATARGLIRMSFSGAARVAARTPLPVGYDASLLEAPVRQLEEYFAGDRREFDLPLDWGLIGGFSRDVLQTLYDTVGYGEVVTYGELARVTGVPDGSQAVGRAMGANPLPVVVPCHRVVAADGLGGYGGGLEIKRRLLEMEGVLPAPLF